jgi:hypothetical protein
MSLREFMAGLGGGQPEARSAAFRAMKRARGVVALNGKFYAIGGCTLAGDTVANNEVFDPANNTWTALASPNRFAGIC